MNRGRSVSEVRAGDAFSQTFDFHISPKIQLLQFNLPDFTTHTHRPQRRAKNMQSIKSSILRHVRVQASLRKCSFTDNTNVLAKYSRLLCTSVGKSPDQIMDQVIGLVKKFDKSDDSKVTETADFQKDLCLDSLDRVELVMAFEQEFSIEIPDNEADKLTCCADVAKYILAGNEQKASDES